MAEPDAIAAPDKDGFVEANAKADPTRREHAGESPARHTPEPTSTSIAGTTNASANPPLNVAAIKGDLDIVQLMLADGHDVNAKSGAGPYPGETPLHSVAYAGHTRIAELLLDYGADVNATDSYRYTPLRRTVEQGHLAMTKLLINKGADIVTRDGNGLSLLHAVARTDHVEIARLLITGGVDVNAMDSFGFTPLDYAQGGGLRMAETLRRLGAICTVC